MTVDLPFVFVVAILSAKDGRAHGAGEVFDMILALERSNVRASKRATALVAKQVKASEVVGLAKWVLAITVLIIDRKEFRSYDLSAVLGHTLSLSAAGEWVKGDLPGT